LNARHHEREAAIVAQAGVSGAITISTNMAGRGTDIQLGGNPDMKLKTILTGNESEEEIAKIREKILKEVEEDKAKVLAAGGLYILGTERHESRRIDNQLRGRSGRQGDPGTSKFFLSLEDDLMRIFGSERMSAVLHRLGLPEGEALIHPWISKALEKAQQKVEERNFDIRKNLLKYDDVMNEQRKVIYAERKKLMETDDVSDSVAMMREECLVNLINTYIPPHSDKNTWQLETLQQELFKTTGFIIPVVNWANTDGISTDEMEEKILNEVEKDLKEKNASISEEIIKMVDKSILLQTLDFLWKEHIATLDMMRHTIILRAYGQKDPLNEYKKEAFNMFSDLLQVLKEQVTVVTCRTVIKANSDEQAKRAEQQKQNLRLNEVHESPDNVLETRKPEQSAQTPVFKQNSAEFDKNDPSTWGKIARNDLCPCGSGKKYKHCHGRIE